MPLRISLLGSPSVQHEAKGTLEIGGPALTLLAYLALQPRASRREATAQLFYPHSEHRQARNNLSKLLWTLRQSIDETFFETTYQTVSLNWQQNIWVDVLEFEQSLRRIQQEWEAPGQKSEPLAAWLSRILGLYRDVFLKDSFLTESNPLQEWATIERERLRRLFLFWSQQLNRFYLVHGRWGDAEAAANSALRPEPLDEMLHMQRLQALAAQGQWERFEQSVSRFTARVQSELDATASDEYTALVESLSRERPVAQIEIGSSPPVRRIFPRTPLRRLYGQDELIERVLRKLITPGTRLLTLTGLGGVGKTVIAQQIGARLVSAFSSGVCFVALSAPHGENSAESAQRLVEMEIARALNVPLHAGQTNEEVLKAWLHGRELLLILDGYEHFIASYPLLITLLGAAPMMRILLTSRERINLSNESIEPVYSLLPPNQPATLEEINASPAVQMFLASARRTMADFRLDTTNAEAIGRICRLTGGLPLAIDMAANWLLLFTPAEIAINIERQISFLVTPHIDVPDRHRSVLAILDHTWQQLTPKEQDLVKALSVFNGHFDREGALRVARCNLFNLGLLLNRSVLEQWDAVSYSLHPLVRAFALGRMSEEPELEARYIEYVFQKLLADDETPSDGQSLWHNDLPRAWEMALHHGNYSLIGKVFAATNRFWQRTAQAQTAFRLLTLLQTALNAGENSIQPAELQQALAAQTRQQLARWQALVAG